MAKATAKKVETRGLTPKQRYDILVAFKKHRDEGDVNEVAASKVGVPYITLYSWLRDGLWKDARHTQPPLQLVKRAKPKRPNRVHRGRKAKTVAKPVKTKKEAKETPKRPKTILRKGPGPSKNYTPANQRKVQLKAIKPEPKAPEAVAQPQPAKPEPVGAGKIIVRLPNPDGNHLPSIEVEFHTLEEAREFARNPTFSDK